MRTPCTYHYFSAHSFFLKLTTLSSFHHSCFMHVDVFVLRDFDQYKTFLCTERRLDDFSILSFLFIYVCYYGLLPFMGPIIRKNIIKFIKYKHSCTTPAANISINRTHTQPQPHTIASNSFLVIVL